jgi:hypothetical protein
MNDTSVIYYTSNREDEKFESKIREKLLSVIGDMPLISVSQKPLEGFGKNICVGDAPYCDASALRQLLIGLKEATTTFAIATESDVLYPPEYFSFIPPTTDNVYRYTNVWILYKRIERRYKGKFWKKWYTEGAQMCGREYWIKMLEKALENNPAWSETPVPLVFTTKSKYNWASDNPVITIKTEQGLRELTREIKDEPPKEELPYWGFAEKIRKELFY